MLILLNNVTDEIMDIYCGTQSFIFAFFAVWHGAKIPARSEEVYLSAAELNSIFDISCYNVYLEDEYK